ncbi:hypothetical protein VC83_08495 [Pseudogymnoascus destructans]|uniref:Uncharacterized protein n=2 Tax=Pseudogymnoascus destructans TaxID=655981 RepID=L8FYM0_PSED2|nr:uncharacterized protein VC83_08495 [Pseudogymnoascus destructans]ELR04811.1 hypothetical protein GMDG_07037 [Pseudogymnoascus destructans 20631-21]OAF55104.1 hypothetical protein VC83_08495 [Pseudogymnoascus destructans]
MRSTLMLAVASALVATSAASDAPKVTGNPTDVTYKAQIAPDNKNGVSGFVEIAAGPQGNGASIKYQFDLPKEGGPFTFHIHENPVNATGLCASTSAHLDPYHAGEKPACDTSKLSACQVGDLSGKIGDKLPSGAIVGELDDAFTSLVVGAPAFIGNRSIVVHASDKTRIACANFALVNSAGGSRGGSASPTGGAGGGGSARNGTGATRPSVTPTATHTGAAAVVSGSVLGLLGVLAVGAALL